MTVLPFAPNARTFARLKLARERERERICKKVGIELSDAPLFEEELRFLAYAESLKR